MCMNDTMRKLENCLVCKSPIRKDRNNKFYCSRRCMGIAQRRPINERFWSRVDKRGPNDCWEWMGGRYHSGHGSTGADINGERRTHRLSWVFHNGPIPNGACVLHACDNPPCVNPKHLFLGSQLENVADMKAKGRTAIGEQHSQARLKEDDVRNIFRLKNAGCSLQELSTQFGVSKSCICSILKRRLWPHVSI